MNWQIPTWWARMKFIWGIPQAELWLADTSGHLDKTQRQAIREHILKSWTAEFPSEPDVLSLEKRPQGSTRNFSISHCRVRAGILVAPDVTRVGFDIEESKRVTSTLIARMSTDQELSAAPSPAHLWAAKESFFKAIPEMRQPPVLSNLLIQNWQQTLLNPGLPQCVWKFSGRGVDQIHGHGLVISDQERIYAFCALENLEQR